ncbi:uncharacterized protein AAES06_016017 isoform 2-T2 [Glossophaga mutica]
MLALSSLTTLLPHFCLSPPHRYRELSGNRRDFSGCGLHCLYPNKSRSQAMAGKERLPVFTQTSWPTEGHKGLTCLSGRTKTKVNTFRAFALCQISLRTVYALCPHSNSLRSCFRLQKLKSSHILLLPAPGSRSSTSGNF